MPDGTEHRGTTWIPSPSDQIRVGRVQVEKSLGACPLIPRSLPCGCCHCGSPSPCSCPSPRWALPVASASQRIGSVVVWADSQDPALFYYLPGELRIARRADGGPDAAFLAVRYLGTTLGGDPERAFVRSCLTAQVEMVPPDDDALSRAASELRRERGRAVRVLPIPVQRDQDHAWSSPPPTPARRNPRRSPAASWSPPGTETSGIVLAATDLHHLSRSGRCAARADGPARRVFAARACPSRFTTRAIDLSAAPATTTPGSATTPAPGASSSTEHPRQRADRGLPPRCRSASMPLAIPDRLALLDIESSSPPGYPLLSVYCYDFAGAQGSGALREDAGGRGRGPDAASA